MSLLSPADVNIDFHVEVLRFFIIGIEQESVV
jgi:hypothetical protein